MNDGIFMDKGKTFEVNQMEWIKVTPEFAVELANNWDEYDEQKTTVLFIRGKMPQDKRWERPLLGSLAALRTKGERYMLAVVSIPPPYQVYILHAGDYLAFLDTPIKNIGRNEVKA